MNISSHEEYGLRCILQLARSEGSQSASKIAEKEGISVEYVSKFMHLFRKAELVDSIRGTQGGFRLAKDASEISLQRVLDALSGKKEVGSEFCSLFTGQKEVCVNHDSCSVRPLWSTVTNYFDLITRRLTLADFLQPEAEVQQVIENVLLESLQKRKVG